jgi:hypothetical protein
MSYRARYYNPNTGRFASEDQPRHKGDPISLLNAYGYVANPIQSIDPLGLFEIDASCRCYPWTAPAGMQGPMLFNIDAAVAEACSYVNKTRLSAVDCEIVWC